MKIQDAAYFFISKVDRSTGETITHLKLQKLLYYAQAWHLSTTGERLFNARFEAWAHGPVCPEIYTEYRYYGYNPLPQVESFNITDLPRNISKFLEYVWNRIGDLDAKKLEKLTHEELPWIEARGNTPCGESCNGVISESTMRDYYKGLAGMKERKNKIKPLFTLDEIKKVAPSIDRSSRGTDEEYFETINQEMEQFKLLRERAVGGWEEKI